MRLRLTRVGSRKNPIWRVVAADGRAKRDGRVLETLGRYNPQRQPSEIVLDRERIDHWLARGAQPSETVRKLIRATERGAPPATASQQGASGGGTAGGGPVPAGGGQGSDGGSEPGGVSAEGTASDDDAVTAEEVTGDPAAAEESASVAEAASADEGDATVESQS